MVAAAKLKTKNEKVKTTKKNEKRRNGYFLDFRLWFFIFHFSFFIC